jgi:Dolichyl-phosphate-mannose-protein mannosyltransferase
MSSMHGLSAPPAHPSGAGRGVGLLERAGQRVGAYLESDRLGVDLQLIGLTLVIKLGLLLLGILAVNLLAGRALTSPIQILEIWNQWDAPHYQDLAVLGYRATDPGVLTIDGYRRAFPGDLPLYIVFFPLFPWLVGAVTAVLGDPLISAFVVSGIASFLVAPLLYRLVRDDFGHRAGTLAAWFALLFPTAYFLHIGYTESLFLALVLGSFLAARHDRWWLAGILGGLAALTRVNGLVLLPALAADAWLAWRRDPEHRLRGEWLGIGLVGFGFLAYLGLNQAVYGDAFTFLRVQREHWFKSLAPPWDGIAGVVNSLGAGGPGRSLLTGGWMELAFIGLGLAGTVYAAFRFRPSWFVWMAGNWLLFTSTSFVLSVPRYSLTLFPLFAIFALEGRRIERAVAIGVISLAGFVYFASEFAIGHWAF